MTLAGFFGRPAREQNPPNSWAYLPAPRRHGASSRGAGASPPGPGAAGSPESAPGSCPSVSRPRSSFPVGAAEVGDDTGDSGGTGTSSWLSGPPAEL